MTASTISSDNQVTRFQKEVRHEYVRGGRFGPFIGNNENSIIQVNRNLKKTSIGLVAALDGAGVNGSSALGGNEESLDNYAQTFQPTYWRNGVLIDNEENEKAEFDLFQEAKPSLMSWAQRKKREHMIQALMGMQLSGTYHNYGGAEGAFGSTEASAANMDTWNTNNQDRILYGAAKSNNTSGNHTTSLATIDTTADKMSAAMLTLMKRMAEQANPLIRPVMVDNDEPVYVVFVGAYTFRDLQLDTTIAAANRDARPRDIKANPIFTGGDLLYDGLIIKKVPEIDGFIDGGSGVLTGFAGEWGASAAGDGLDNAGDSASRVAPAFLCGAQAVTFGVGRMARFVRRKEDDYEHLNGVGVTMKHDIKKNVYNNKDHGILTCFHSSAADA